MKLAQAALPIDEENQRQIVGTNLKMLRQNAGFTQKEIAERLGQTIFAIKAVEQGKTFPKISNLIRFALLYGVSMDEICGFMPVFREKVQSEIVIENAKRRLSRLGLLKKVGVGYDLEVKMTRRAINEGGQPSEIEHIITHIIHFSTASALIHFVDVLIDTALSTEKTFQQVFDEKVKTPPSAGDVYFSVYY